VIEVVGEVDRGHPSLADFALDCVAAREGGGETGELGVSCQGTGSGLRCAVSGQREENTAERGNGEQDLTGCPPLYLTPCPPSLLGRGDAS